MPRMLAKVDVALTAEGERLDADFAVIEMNSREFDNLIGGLVPLTLVIDSGTPFPYVRRLTRKD